MAEIPITQFHKEREDQISKHIKDWTQEIEQQVKNWCDQGDTPLRDLPRGELEKFLSKVREDRIAYARDEIKSLTNVGGILRLLDDDSTQIPVPNMETLVRRLVEHIKAFARVDPEPVSFKLEIVDGAEPSRSTAREDQVFMFRATLGGPSYDPPPDKGPEQVAFERRAVPVMNLRTWLDRERNAWFRETEPPFPALMDRDVRSGEEVTVLGKDISELLPSRALSTVRSEWEKSSKPIEVLHLQIPLRAGSVAIPLTVFVCFLLLYFHIRHLATFQSGPKGGVDVVFPWIALFPHRGSLFVWEFSVLGIPVLAASLLFYKLDSYNGDSWSLAVEGMGLALTIASLALAIVCDCCIRRLRHRGLGAVEQHEN